MQITVQAQDDFLQKLAVRGRPAASLAELIWNGLDADAQSVEVSIAYNLAGGVDEIRVVDDGTGFGLEAAKEGFSSLGGSWKKMRERTREQGRLLHGKDGQGRFRAFGLGAAVTWRSGFRAADGSLNGVLVRGSIDDLKHFQVDGAEAERTGTVVVVQDVWDNLKNLEDGSVFEELTETLALYLREYPSVAVTFAGKKVTPSLIEDRIKVIALDPVVIDGREVDDLHLEIVEWTRSTSRSLYLCDESGFTLGRTNPGIHAPGFDFTAYLRTSFFREIADSLSLGDEHPGLQAVLEAAKEVLREHFRSRGAARVREQVVEWKASDIYPYAGEPTSPVERAERQVFDVVAYNVANYLPTFAKSDAKTQKFSFRLLQQAIEANPGALRRILSDVLQLPVASQDELAALLERTSLSAIITAAKEVADRLDFLRGLELLLFNPQSKRQLLERSQLHRILASETWIFGEQFHLTVDDQSLTEVLRKHEGQLRRESDETSADNLSETELPEVLREDGSRGIVDLMLSRRIPQRREDEREHLVVELKRPTQSINPAVAAQIRSYAFAVQRDDRFSHTKTRWEFWALSNRVTEQVMWEMEDAANGVLKKTDTMLIKIKTWGEVLEECRGRLTFFQEKLRYAPEDDEAVAYLRAVHERYLPDALADLMDS